MKYIISFLIALLWIPTCFAASQNSEDNRWQREALPFHGLNLTSNGNSFWVCGTDEGIATSSDGGQHWRIKHTLKDSGALLLIQFPTPNFGYAAGTGGVLLITNNAGETWDSLNAGADTILQASFSDAQHGLIHTMNALLYTADGGAHWTPIIPSQDPDRLKSFSYPFSLVALDPSHMAVMLKSNGAQYYSQTFLITDDGGKTWSFADVPDSTLYSFLRVGDQYWTVGTQVVGKGKPGAGLAAPAAFYSSDGRKWISTANDIAACHMEMCTVCQTSGCLDSNGQIATVFADKTAYLNFQPTRELSAKWAATNSTMCFVGKQFECSTFLQDQRRDSKEHLPIPTISVRPLKADSGSVPRCIVCGLDQFIISNKATGPLVIKLAINIAKNGTVESAEVINAPTPDVKEKIERSVDEWIFEPYLKDNIPTAIKLDTAVKIYLIKPR